MASRLPEHSGWDVSAALQTTTFPPDTTVGTRASDDLTERAPAVETPFDGSDGTGAVAQGASMAQEIAAACQRQVIEAREG